MIFNPVQYLKTLFGAGFFKGRLLNSDLELKQLALQSILKATNLSKREVEATVYKVVDNYEEKMKKLKKEKVRAFKAKACVVERSSTFERRTSRAVLQMVAEFFQNSRP